MERSLERDWQCLVGQPAQAGQPGWGRWLDCRGTTLFSTSFIAGRRGLAELGKAAFTGQLLSGIQFNKNFLHFHHDQVTKEASDTMLVEHRIRRRVLEAVSVVPEHPGGLPPKPGREKMEKRILLWRKLL